MVEYSMEHDMAHFKMENAALREEVAQLQADKEFVWSLWKRLQIASPDLTQAIAEVVKREKEKAEIKDRKVLTIIQMKDSRIEQLEKLLIERNAEIKTLIEGKVCLEEMLTKLQIENQDYSDKLTFQEDQLRGKIHKERTQGQLYKQLVDAFERDKVGLHKQVSEQKASNGVLRAENADLNAVKTVLEAKVQSLQQDLAEMRRQYDKILGDYENAKKHVYQHDVDVKQLELQLDYKETEMTSFKKELDELWITHHQCKHHAADQASVINQLQSLQQETQKMLQTQNESHLVEFQSLNSMYRDLNVKMTGLKTLETEQRKEIEALKVALTKKDEQIQELSVGVRERTVKIQTQLSENDDFSSQVTASILEKDYKVYSLETERDLLKDRLREKSMTLKSLQKENVVDLDLDVTPVKLCVPGRLSAKDVQIQARYETLEKRYRNTQQLLKLKSKELDEVRSAHTRRLERLKNVQNNYEIVKNQLEALEVDLHGVSKVPKRCDARALRVGDSDKVWNELTFFKQENKALMAERLQLQEELDVCKVQYTQSRAEIHELKTILEQAKEDRNTAIEELHRLSEPDENFVMQLQSAKHELFGKETALESILKEKKELDRRCETLETERKKIRHELTDALRDLAEKRIEVCDVKEQLRKTQKSLRKLRRGKVLKPTKNATKEPESREDSLDNEWEEVNEFVSTESEANATLTSTGEERTQMSAPTARQIESIDVHIQRHKRKNFVEKLKSVAKREITQEHVLTKDMATSPHKFDDRVRRVFNSSLRKQLKNAHDRLGLLQEQLKIVRREKILAERTCEEQKSALDNLQKDFSSANLRLKTLRTSIHRVTTENEALLAERIVLEKKVLNAAAMMDDDSGTSSPREPMTDRKILESRLKVSSTECSKLLLQIKSLRVDVEEKDSKINEITERLNRLDRDNAQKRLLLEDTRLRLKLSQEQLQTNLVVIEELNNQVKTLTATVEKQKVNVESAKKRAAASLKDKREYESLYQKTTQKLEDVKMEFEKTASSLSRVQVKLASKDREMNEIEEAAHEQMCHTVRKGEAVINSLKTELQVYHKRMNTHKRFVDSLVQRILRSTNNARSVVNAKTEQLNPKENLRPEYMEKASQMAKNILNITQEDLDDLLGSEMSDRDLQVVAEDKKWTNNCKKLLEEKGDFSVPLADMIMEKVEEQFRLLSTLLTTS